MVVVAIMVLAALDEVAEATADAVMADVAIVALAAKTLHAQLAAMVEPFEVCILAFRLVSR